MKKHHTTVLRWMLPAVLLPVLLFVLLLQPLRVSATPVAPSIAFAEDTIDRHTIQGNTITIRFTLTHGSYQIEGCELYVFEGDIHPLKGDRVDDEAEYAKGYYAGSGIPQDGARTFRLAYNTSRLVPGVYTILVYPTVYDENTGLLRRIDSGVVKTLLYIDQEPGTGDDDPPPPAGTQPMYRLYFPGNHEHLYTADANEKEVLVKTARWEYEGIAWYAPLAGDPVYRLFNPYTKEHHYTMDAYEYETLGTTGWEKEGIGWYSDPSWGVPIFRLYCPTLETGSHHYTTSLAERTALLASGAWHQEGIGWYGVK